MLLGGLKNRSFGVEQGATRGAPLALRAASSKGTDCLHRFEANAHNIVSPMERRRATVVAMSPTSVGDSSGACLRKASIASR